jgi:agmatine deiminase
MTYPPRDAGFRQPAEWAPHLSCWVAWPSDPVLWPELSAAQNAFTQMCRAIARPARQTLGEQLEVIVQDARALSEAQGALMGVRARFHILPFGDIWMRDTCPVFLEDAQGAVASVRFQFNGWGGKYLYPGDDQLAARVQELSNHRRFVSSLVCEGGAVESDGNGLCMTTREVVLNSNRNPGLSQAEADAQLQAALGADRIIWLDAGLLNDHTDGHIDNIARFVAPARVLCMRAEDQDDPNRDVLAEIAATLKREALEVVTLPSPGLVTARDGRALPASYLNFYIANHSVVVPVFDSVHDAEALRVIGRLFPGRVVIGVNARVFLEEGGTLHCITQQQPAGLGTP